MITRYKLAQEIGQAYGAWYWRQKGLFNYKAGPEGKAERVFHILKYRALRAAMRAGQYTAEQNKRGNFVMRDTEADSFFRMRGADRYAYDFGPCREWEQYDTWQDASYFGVWFHPISRLTFTYCEGDRILVQCPTQESFEAELADMVAFYSPSRGQKAEG